jgi:hypothetical protein
VLGFELGEGEAVLEFACHLGLGRDVSYFIFFFSRRRRGCAGNATYLANLSPPEDSVGHDLGLVVLPWGGHIEDRG